MTSKPKKSAAPLRKPVAKVVVAKPATVVKAAPTAKKSAAPVKPAPKATAPAKSVPPKQPAALKPVPAKPLPTKPAVAGKPAAAAVPAPALKKGAAAKAQPQAKPAAPAPVLTAAQTKAAEKAAAKAAGSHKLTAIERRGPVMPEERQSQLKLLIALGKEQSYLTYSQVNDHLPSEIVDPEQIEDIVNTINDMGIPVYEKAPDSEPLLAAEASAPADEEAIEEAAAALAALDAELGRTTDPVRMYMREMGTVELLTREGEISIAKRIEEGLDAVKTALSHYPSTIEHILKIYEPVKAGQGRLIDIIVGFIDPNAPDVIAQPQNPTKLEVAEEDDKEDDDETEGDAEEEEVIDTGPDPEEAARRFASIGKLHAHVLTSIAKLGAKDPKTLKLRSRLSDEFMELKLAPRMFEALIHKLRAHIGEVRQLEKEIMVISVRDAGMPRKDFIATFPKNETNIKWLAKHMKAGKKYSTALVRFKDEIERRQKKLSDLEVLYHLSINDIKEINRDVSIGEAKARRAKK
ncbi:MAG: RNA polymerase sigma factor region1.1 domain-containing protein, partial [Pseudomonadota bacterium]